MAKWLSYCLVTILVTFSTPQVFSEEQESTIRVFHLKYAQAKSVKQTLEQLLDDKPVRFVEDDRTNTLFVRGDEKHFQIAIELIEVLDRDAPKITKTTSNQAAATISCPANGLIEWQVKNGAHVEKGDVLALLKRKNDSPRQNDAQQAVRKQKARHEQELRHKQLLERNAAFLRSKLGLAKAEFDLQQKKLMSELASAKSRRTVNQELHEHIAVKVKNGMAESEVLFQLKANIEEAERATELLKGQIDFNKEHAFPIKVMEIEMQLAKATIDSSNAAAVLAANVAALEIQRELSTAQMRRTKVENAIVQIRAPFEGTVNINKLLRNGANVREGQSMATIH